VSHPDGTVDLQSYWAGLAVRRALVANLHATLGARLYVLNARAMNFTTPGNAVIPAGAAFLSVDWRQPLGDTLFLLAQLGGQARFSPEVLVVPGSTAVLVLPVWSFFANAGLGLKL
jgi:hypothetical protein